MKQDKVTTGMMMIRVADLEPHERALNFWPDSEERLRDRLQAEVEKLERDGVR